MFEMSLALNNDVFVNPNGEFDQIYGGYEVAAILRKVANQIQNGSVNGKCMDSNGNGVGSWRITERR